MLCAPTLADPMIAAVAKATLETGGHVQVKPKCDRNVFETNMISDMFLILTTDIDECANPEANDCETNAVCNNTEGSYSCSCVSGYKGDGKNCTGNCCLNVPYC